MNGHVLGISLQYHGRASRDRSLRVTHCLRRARLQCAPPTAAAAHAMRGLRVAPVDIEAQNQAEPSRFAARTFLSSPPRSALPVVSRLRGPMTRQILIDNIVRQTTILIAQLATSGGVRSPLAQIADRIFLDLARELDAQGISRKVSADMFGMALRSYRRRVRQLSESSTERGRSLWEAVLDYLSRGALVTREEVLRRFDRDEAELVRGVLNDLCESGLVFRLGAGKSAAYRAATAEEIAELRTRAEGLSELVWMLVYREGPLSADDLAARTSLKSEVLAVCLDELVETARIAQLPDGKYESSRMVLPLGSAAGWEAALFDHFQAVVQTMCKRLQKSGDSAVEAENGGSTYTYSIWAGHPFEDEVRGLLEEFRERHSRLRERVRAYNESNPAPPHYDRITFYGGMCVTPEDPQDSEQQDEDH